MIWQYVSVYKRWKNIILSLAYNINQTFTIQVLLSMPVNTQLSDLQIEISII